MAGLLFKRVTTKDPNMGEAILDEFSQYLQLLHMQNVFKSKKKNSPHDSSVITLPTFNPERIQMIRNKLREDPDIGRMRDKSGQLLFHVAADLLESTLARVILGKLNSPQEVGHATITDEDRESIVLLKTLLVELFRVASGKNPEEPVWDDVPPQFEGMRGEEIRRKYVQSRKYRRLLHSHALATTEKLVEIRQTEFDVEFQLPDDGLHKNTLFFPYDERLLPLLLIPVQDDEDDDDDDEDEYDDDPSVVVKRVVHLTKFFVLRTLAFEFEWRARQWVDKEERKDYNSFRFYKDLAPFFHIPAADDSSVCMVPLCSPPTALPTMSMVRALRYEMTINKDFFSGELLVLLMQGDKYLIYDDDYVVDFVCKDGSSEAGRDRVLNLFSDWMDYEGSVGAHDFKKMNVQDDCSNAEEREKIARCKHLLNYDSMLSEFLVAVSSQEGYPFCNSHCLNEAWSMTAEEDDEVIARMKLTEVDPMHNCNEVTTFFNTVGNLVRPSFSFKEILVSRASDQNKDYVFGVPHALSLHSMLIHELNRTCESMKDIDEGGDREEDFQEQYKKNIKRDLFMSNGGKRPKLALVCSLIEGLGEAARLFNHHLDVEKEACFETKASGILLMVSLTTMAEAILKRIPAGWATSRLGSFIVYSFLQCFAHHSGRNSRYEETNEEIKTQEGKLGLDTSRYMHRLQTCRVNTAWSKSISTQIDDVARVVRAFYLRGFVDTDIVVGYGDFLEFFGLPVSPHDVVLYDHEINYGVNSVNLNKTIPNIADRSFIDFFDNEAFDDLWITSEEMNRSYCPMYDFSLLRMINFHQKEYFHKHHATFSKPFRDAVVTLLLCGRRVNMPSMVVFYICSFVPRFFFLEKSERACWNPECDLKGTLRELWFADREVQDPKEKERNLRVGDRDRDRIWCRLCDYASYCSTRCLKAHAKEHKKANCFLERFGSGEKGRGGGKFLCQFLEDDEKGRKTASGGGGRKGGGGGGGGGGGSSSGGGGAYGLENAPVQSFDEDDIDEVWEEVDSSDEDIGEAQKGKNIERIEMHFCHLYQARGRKPFLPDEDDSDDMEED